MRVFRKTVLLFLTVFILLTAITTSVYAIGENFEEMPEINSDDATSVVGDTSIVTVRLGKNYANQYFTLETDAGVDSRPYQADEEGNVEFYFEVGSSSRYELTLLDTGKTLEPLTEVIATQSQLTEDTDEPTQATEGEKGEKKVSPKSIIIFAVGMVIAVSYLVLSKVMPKIKAKKANEEPKENTNDIKTPFDDEEL